MHHVRTYKTPSSQAFCYVSRCMKLAQLTRHLAAPQPRYWELSVSAAAPGLLTPRWACRKEPDEPSAVTGVKPSALPPTPPPRLRVPAFPDKLGEGLSVPIPEEAGLGGRAAGETPKRAVAGEAGEKGLLSASASEAASAAAAASPRAAGA